MFNDSTGDWFFLEKITCEALNDHEGSVSSGGRLTTNFHFADDFVVNAEEEEQAGVLETVPIQPSQGSKWTLVQTRQN